MFVEHTSRGGRNVISFLASEHQCSQNHDFTQHSHEKHLMMHTKLEPCVEEVADEDVTTSPKTADRKRINLLRRLGWQSITILVLTTIAALAVIGFLGFLWFANLEDGVWHRIMVNGWATRAVSIATLVLRSAIDLQAGVAAAMLAALVLESSSVRLRDAARISTMRAGSPQPRALLDIIPAMSSFKCQFFLARFRWCMAQLQQRAE